MRNIRNVVERLSVSGALHQVGVSYKVESNEDAVDLSSCNQLLSFSGEDICVQENLRVLEIFPIRAKHVVLR